MSADCPEYTAVCDIRCCHGVDNRAAGLHRWQRRLREEERSKDVCSKSALEFFLGNLINIFMRHLKAGVVDNNVEVAKFFDGSRNK
jgi:hypothetical protein